MQFCKLWMPLFEVFESSKSLGSLWVRTMFYSSKNLFLHGWLVLNGDLRQPLLLTPLFGHVSRMLVSMRTLYVCSHYCVGLPFCFHFHQGFNKDWQQVYDLLLWLRQEYRLFLCTLLGERKIVWGLLKLLRGKDRSALRIDSQLIQRKYLQLFVK